MKVITRIVCLVALSMAVNVPYKCSAFVDAEPQQATVEEELEAPTEAGEPAEAKPPEDDFARLGATRSDVETLLAAAAGMPRKDFDALFDGPAPLTQDEIRGQPLTLLLLVQPVRANDSIDGQLEFDFNRENPSPKRWTEAMKCNVDRAEWASILPPDCITSLEIPIVDNDVAHGTVAVKSNRNWRGQIHFSMRKAEGAWQVIEFRLPIRAIGTRRTKDNKWEPFSLESNDGKTRRNAAKPKNDLPPPVAK